MRAIINLVRAVRARPQANSACYTSRGIALIEALLIIPLLLLVFLGGLEVARYLNTKHVVANLAYEAGNLARRDCRPGSARTQRCSIRQQSGRISQLAQALLPGANVTVSAYIRDEISDPSYPSYMTYMFDSAAPAHVTHWSDHWWEAEHPPTRFNDLSIESRVSALQRPRLQPSIPNSVIIAEVIYQYGPLTPFFTGGELYAAAIF